MSYRIRPDATVRTNVRRLVRRELARALAALDEPGALGLQETVHDVRKRCKKVRGVLRLARPGLGAEYGRANAEVRDAARELSPLRDAHATLATLDELIASTHGERAAGGALDDAREALVRRADEAERADASRALASAAEGLARVRDRVGRWSPDDDVAILLSGLSRNYGRGRRAYRASLADPSGEAFHEWRKRAKYGWYHARLLQPVAPSALGPLAKRLKDLSDGLGDEHDLAVLRGMILASPADFGDGAEEAIALIDALRGDLQDRCHRLGARLYAERPRAFGERVGGYWSAWHALGRERPVGAIDDLASEPAHRRDERQHHVGGQRRAAPALFDVPHRALADHPRDRVGTRAAAAQARCGTRTPTRTVSEPLVELEIGPGPPEQRQGLRVLDDGRLEYRGDGDVGIDAAGHAELRSVPLEWRLQWTYTQPELDALRGAIADADDPPLRAEYGPDTRAIHPQQHVWRLRVGDRVREVTIRGRPGTRVDALERLWRRLFELHQPPGETSVWRVWTDDGPVERLVDGEVAEVPVLAGASRSLFHAEAIAPEGEGEPSADGPPADVPLVEVAFRSEGEEIDRLQIFDDGRQVELRDGATEDPGRLSPARMRAIRSALRRVDWRALPQRIELPH